MDLNDPWDKSWNKYKQLHKRFNEGAITQKEFERRTTINPHTGQYAFTEETLIEKLKYGAITFCKGLLGIIAGASYLFMYAAMIVGTFLLISPYPPFKTIFRLPDDYQRPTGWGIWGWILAGAVVALIWSAKYFIELYNWKNELYDEVKSLRARVSELENRDSPDD